MTTSKLSIHDGDPPGFNLEGLREIFRADEAGFAEVFQVIVNDLRDWMSNWTKARADKDVMAMAKLSHALLGSSGMFGAEQTSSLARQVCDMLRGSGHAPDELLDRLATTVQDNLHQLALRGYVPD